MNQQYYPQGGAEAALTKYFSKTKKQVDSELSKYISTLSHLDLYPQIEYAVLSEGKRFRPLIVILSAESVGGKSSKAMRLAMAFELMHTSTLVHDDVIDEDDMRRGRLSLHKKWSINDAILTGDSLIALSVELASSYGEKILKTVAQSALELCEGEHMDLVGSLKVTTEEVYFKKIRNKSASLCRAAAFCGAIAGGGTPSEAQALSKFGENFGVAYQLRDDVLDFSANGTLNLEDSKNGRITLPLINCYATGSLPEKREIEKFLVLVNENPPKARDKANEILQLVRAKGAFEYCENKIDQYLSRALTSISALEETEYKAYLIEMAKTLRSWAGKYEKQSLG